MTKNEKAYQELLKRYAKALIAEWAGVSRQALTKWKTVPAARVAVIAQAANVKPEDIRPEPYAND